MTGYDDLMKLWLQHELSFKKVLIAVGTVGANRLVLPSGTSVAVGTLEATDILGVHDRGEDVLTTNGVLIKVAGIGKVMASEPCTFGRPLKCTGDGKAGMFIDATLGGSAIGDATLVAGFDFANQPANDTVDVHSDDGGDVGQTVTVYGLENGGTTIESEVYTLAGVAVQAGSTSFDTILAVVISAVCAGNVTVEENSGSADIIVYTAGQLGSGYVAVTAGYARYGIPDIVASGATTKELGIIGTSDAGAALSEQQTLAGAVKTALANSYATITHILTGDVEAARTVSVTVADEADSASAKVGLALEAATVVDQVIEYAIARMT